MIWPRYSGRTLEGQTVTHYKKLVGERCYLSPCAPEDVDTWAEWFNDLEVALPLGDEAYTTFCPQRERSLIEGGDGPGSRVFSIVDLETDALIGRCLLFDVDLVNRSAMLGLAIGEKAFWGRGYGQEATRLLLEYAFGLLNLNSVALGVYACNERAIHCYRQVGFKEFGRRRQARIVAGEKFDLVLMDILAEEFDPAYVRGFIA